MLDRLDTPAQVVSDLGVTLMQNALAEALLGPQTQYTGLRRSVIYRWFTDPTERRLTPRPIMTSTHAATPRRSVPSTPLAR